MILNKLTLLRLVLVSLITFFTNLEVIQACEVTFSWTPNSETNLAGYRIYYGTEAGNYTDYVDVGTPLIVNGSVIGSVTDLTAGESYFFSATAYNTDDLESDFSDEISWTCPAVDEPVVDEPVVDEPIVDEPIVDEPVVDEPVVDEPVVDEPVVDEPVIDEPVVDEPVVDEPVVDESVIDEPVVNEPVVDEPVVDEPVVDEPVVDEPVVDETDELTMVENFVIRFYEQCLYRAPDVGGLDGWVDALLTGDFNGADLAESFIFSKEFTNLDTTNEEFVTTLYKAFFNRVPDTTGFNGWVNTLNNGASRKDVLDGFTSSKEFKILCDDYSIIPNNQGSPVEHFVTRFYEQCLGRNPDQEGLDGWVNALVSGYYTGADVAENFIFSQEFTSAKTTNEEYITILYKAFFDREPDSSGFGGWLNALNNGWSREEILDSFISSKEFKKLCDYYGIPNK